MVEVVVGGFYKTRDGRKFGPAEWNDGFFSMNGWHYNCHGIHGYRGQTAHSIRKLDLIAEWVNEPAAPVSSAPEVEDGKWIGWNGGVNPEHPETVVEVAITDGPPCESTAEEWFWDAGRTRIVAYRVIKRYVEPKKAREFWLVGGSICLNREAAERRNIHGHDGLMEIIHVREVIEPEIDQAVK